MYEVEKYAIHIRHVKYGVFTYLMAVLTGFLLALLFLGTGFFLIFGKPSGADVTPPLPIMGTDSASDPSEPTAPVYNPDSELRGIYIASVYNINYPSAKGLDVATLKDELEDIVATCLDANLNAIYFQVRPSSDALYRSAIFPASEYVSGTQGETVDGFDSLAYLIDIAHANNLTVHAWVNPLRVTVGSQSSPQIDTEVLAENNPARLHPDWTVAYADGRLYYDAGNPDVRQLIADGVREIAENYAVDGILFDDYFYPYPVYTTVDGRSVLSEFDDTASYTAYGKDQALDDWRRQNVNLMVESCYDAIKEANPDCAFGIAPFGIWQNDDGTNGGSDTAGLESYSSIYCDPTAWIAGDYVDYLAPQLYWRFSTSVARYDVLVRWWNTLLEGTDVDLVISHGVYNYDTWENASDELRNQVAYARSELAYRGSILYGYAALKNDSQGLLGEVREVFSDEIIYTSTVSNERDLIISIPYSGSYIDGEGTFVIGTSDPAEPLYLDGIKLGRTKSGYFSAFLPLAEGKNTFTFTHKGVETDYVINRGIKPPSVKTVSYAQLDSYQIASVTPAYDWFGTTSTLSVSATAPSGSTVTAEIGGKSFKLSPTLNPPNDGDYMKEVYTGTVTLDLPVAGKVQSLGTIKFTAKRGLHEATADSASIRIGGTGASIPVEILSDDTEMKIQPDSWYYDDYSPQSSKMTDNAVSLSSGRYKLRCGGYVSAANVKELGGDALGLAKLGAASVSTDQTATYISFATSINIPLNCYVENGEFIVTLYNADISTIPTIKFADNPIFTSIRGEKSAKANAYKYYFKLVSIDNFYGFDYAYRDGQLIIELTNPTVLPDSATPLVGKTIILDAGHGGPNPGALGPLGSAEGAMNESDFNLEIVLAAYDKLTALGAEVILIRDRETTIDVPIADRLDTLIETDPDLCLSIHQNSMPYTADITTIRGLVGLYWSDSGYMLTRVMGETISDSLNKLNRSPTKQRLAMVRNPKFPSTLIEVCFITNIEEYERMMQPETINTVAESIAQGVLNYYEAQRPYIK